MTPVENPTSILDMALLSLSIDGSSCLYISLEIFSSPSPVRPGQSAVGFRVSAQAVTAVLSLLQQNLSGMTTSNTCHDSQRPFMIQDARLVASCLSSLS